MVKLALYVRLEAKPRKEAEVEAFLRSGLALVQTGTGDDGLVCDSHGKVNIGIFDAFADEAGRQTHLAGKVAAALMAKAPELLEQTPKIEKIEVLAAKLPK
jgi:quinol monooxygenase YgiN